MTFDGTWNVSVHTPMGEQQGVLVLATRDGELSGQTSNFGTTLPISDVRADGDRLAWLVRAEQPFRMELEFAVTVEGDRMAGTVTSGTFGEAPVSGRREP